MLNTAFLVKNYSTRLTTPLKAKLTRCDRQLLTGFNIEEPIGQLLHVKKSVNTDISPF